jgi:NTE family protein
VLEALRDVKVVTPDGDAHSLLDEIDLISAVSGGAFTAAYYALNGKETFDSYAPRFLNHDTRKDLWHKVLAPVNWARLAKPLVSRSDLEVEYFDDELFDGATVDQLMNRSPRVIVSSTDLVRRKPFAFTREQLNGICVDPKSVPVARAVFASAATPIYFAPLVIEDVRRTMRLRTTGQREQRCGRGRRRLPPRTRRAAAVLSRFRQVSYLHLADGALADNLGAAPSSTRWRSVTR